MDVADDRHCSTGSDFSPNTGYDGHGRETSFAVGVQGAAADQIGEVHRIIADCFAKAAAEPFDPAQV